MSLFSQLKHVQLLTVVDLDKNDMLLLKHLVVLAFEFNISFLLYKQTSARLHWKRPRLTYY